MSLKLEDHVFRVLENQKRLFDFLGEYNWNFDMDRGVLTFSRERKVGFASLFKKAQAEVIAECTIQILGTQSQSSQTWLWAWANTESGIPESLLRGVEQVRQEGLQQCIPQFTRESLPLPHDVLGDMLAVICTGYLNLFTYFACPYPGGAMFTAIEAFSPVEGKVRDALLVIQTIQAGISVFSFSHREAVYAYLGEPLSFDGSEGVWGVGHEQVHIRFDEQGRIANLQAQLQKAI